LDLLWDDKPNLYICLHLVIASEFFIPPTLYFVKGWLTSYESSKENIDNISNALEQVRLLDEC
jgi:hypothetical protein